MDESWIENKVLLLDIVKESLTSNPTFSDYKDDILVFTGKYIDQVKSNRFSFKNTELMNRSILHEVHQYMNYIHTESMNPILTTKARVTSNHNSIQPIGPSGYEFNQDVSHFHFEKQRTATFQKSYETKQQEREAMIKKNIPSKIDFTDPIDERNELIPTDKMQTLIDEEMKKRELISYIKEEVKSEIAGGTSLCVQSSTPLNTTQPAPVESDSTLIEQKQTQIKTQTQIHSICPIDSIDDYYSELNHTKDGAGNKGDGVDSDNLDINIQAVHKNTNLKTLTESSLKSKITLEPIEEVDESNENIQKHKDSNRRDAQNDSIQQSIRDNEYSIPRSYSISNNEGGYMEWSRSTIEVYEQHTNQMTLNIESDEMVELHHLVFIYNENASSRDSNNEYIKIYTTISEGDTKKMNSSNELNLFIKDTLCKNIERFTGMYYIHVHRSDIDIDTDTDTNLSTKNEREVKSVILEFPYALQLKDIKDVFVQGVIREGK